MQCSASQRANTTMFFVSKSGFDAKAAGYLKEHGIHTFVFGDVVSAFGKLTKK